MSITQPPFSSFPTTHFNPPSMISSTLFKSLSKTLISFSLQKSNLYHHKLKLNPIPFVGPSQNTHFQRPSFGFRGYANVAEAIAASSSTDDDVCGVVDELQEILKEMRKDDRRQSSNRWRLRQARQRGMGEGKYLMLRRRQMKVETEAWEHAADEYRELLMDMCEQKLAPNLPYIKLLFLGWFEPLCNAISKEQDLCRGGKSSVTYGPYMDKLPADMMVRIHNFLERTKKKKVDKNQEMGDTDGAETKENEKLNKKVTNLMKRQKIQAVRYIVKGHDDSKAWSTETKAKVGSRLIELLTQTAFIQPPAYQLGDSQLDIRPAFVHTFKTQSYAKNSSRRYGVIECDPLVLKGLEKTAKHMVIPYMPMLVPPLKWTG